MANLSTENTIMQFIIQVKIEDDSGNTVTEDALSIDHNLEGGLIGLSLLESKRLLKRVQQLFVTRQMEEYTHDHRCCPHCQRKRRIKGHYPIQYRRRLRKGLPRQEKPLRSDRRKVIVQNSKAEANGLCPESG